MDLLLLAPDIQEEILRMETIDCREPIAQIHLRPLVKLTSWAEQRRAWRWWGTGNVCLKKMLPLDLRANH